MTSTHLYQEKAYVEAYNEAKEKLNGGFKVPQIMEYPTVMNVLGDLTDKKIIDYGCGPGTYTRRFAKKAKKVIGVDLAETMIQLAKETTIHEGFTNVEYHLKDCLTDLNLGQFDIVFSGFMLNHATSDKMLDGFINSMYNSTKPGGLCAGLIPNYSLKYENLPKIWKYGIRIERAKTVKNYDPFYVKMLDRSGDAPDAKVLVDIVDMFIDPEHFKNAFLKAGFQDFKYEKMKVHCIQEDQEFYKDLEDNPTMLLFTAKKF